MMTGTEAAMTDSHSPDLAIAETTVNTDHLLGLPVVTVRGATYYVGELMRRFHEVGDPAHVIDFESDTGCVIRETLLTLECPMCGATLSLGSEAGDLVTCWRCFGEFPIDLAMRWFP